MPICSFLKYLKILWNSGKSRFETMFIYVGFSSISNPALSAQSIESAEMHPLEWRDDVHASCRESKLLSRANGCPEKIADGFYSKPLNILYIVNPCKKMNKHIEHHRRLIYCYCISVGFCISCLFWGVDALGKMTMTLKKNKSMIPMVFESLTGTHPIWRRKHGVTLYIYMAEWKGHKHQPLHFFVGLIKYATILSLYIYIYIIIYQCKEVCT